MLITLKKITFTLQSYELLKGNNFTRFEMFCSILYLRHFLLIQAQFHENVAIWKMAFDIWVIFVKIQGSKMILVISEFDLKHLVLELSW